MQRATVWFGAAVVLGAALVAGIGATPGVARAADAGETSRSASGGKNSQVEREISELDKVVTLTDDQKTQLRAIYADRATAISAWQQANSAKITELNAQAKQANANGDKQAAKAAYEAMRPLSLERNKIDEDARAKALAVLTPEQQTTWSAHQLTQMILRPLRPLELTDEQVQKIEVLSLDASKQIATLPDGKAQSKARLALLKKIHDEVLTDAQREKLDAAAQAARAAKMQAQGATTQPATPKGGTNGGQ